jgi:hypothetical protein
MAKTITIDIKHQRFSGVKPFFSWTQSFLLPTTTISTGASPGDSPGPQVAPLGSRWALGDPWGPRLRPALPGGPPLGGDAAAPRRRSGDIDSPRPALGGLGCLDTPIAGWFIWSIWFIMEKPSINE